MRALILWAEPTSENLGVQALYAGTAHLVRDAFPGATVEAQSFGPGDAPVRIGSSRAQVRRLLSPRNELIDWVKPFDVVVDTRAGDSFTDIYGWDRLWVMSLMGTIAGRARVPVVLGPQTIGPFRTRRGAVLARHSLRTSRLVMARDGASMAAAQAAGRPADLLTTDVAFALDRPALERTRDVVLNVSGLLWGANAHVDSVRYQALVRQLCDQLVADGRRISLLAHVLDSPLADNDVPVARRLAEEIEGDIEVLVPVDLEDVRAMLASAEVVIGSRMHACLNALSVGRPAIPLAYSRKFHPLLDGLGWPLTVDLREPGDHLGRVLASLDDPTLESRVSQVRSRADARIADAQKALRRAF